MLGIKHSAGSSVEGHMNISAYRVLCLMEITLCPALWNPYQHFKLITGTVIAISHRVFVHSHVCTQVYIVYPVICTPDTSNYAICLQDA